MPGWDYGPVLRVLATAAVLFIMVVLGLGFAIGRATAADLQGWFRVQGEVCAKRCVVHRGPPMGKFACQAAAAKPRPGVRNVECRRDDGLTI